MLSKLLASLVLALISIGAKAELPKSLVFGAADWCPYTCNEEKSARNGIVQIYLKEVFAKAGIRLEAKVLPWSRAIREAETGHLNGLLTVVPGESDKLLIVATPLMNYQDCFYTTLDDKWTYKEVNSLNDRHLAAVQDYGYGDEIDKFIAGSDKVVLLNGDALVKRMQSLLIAGRVDTFISEKRVHALEIVNAGMNPKDVLQASCIESNPFYVAIQPDQPWSKELFQVLNKALADKNNLERLKQIEAGFFSAK